MGTRNLTCVVYQGEYKISQYGQWDGYPSGQGATALTFLQSWDREKFTQQSKDGWVTMEEAERLKEGHPEWDRDMGAGVLQFVQDCPDEVIYLNQDPAFAGDSLFCEWAYVIDLDKNTFEVYEGFNKIPLNKNDRFYFLSDGKLTTEDTDTYYPVALKAEFSLNNLPFLPTFLTLTEDTDEENNG